MSDRDVAAMLEQAHMQFAKDMPTRDSRGGYLMYAATLAVAEIRRLRKQIEGHERFAQSVNEALNSGDGSYRP